MLPNLALAKPRLVALGGLMAGLVFVLDQLSKWGLRETLLPDAFSRLVVLPVFQLVHAWNYGVSFSLFTSTEDGRRWILILATGLIAVAVLFFMSKAERLMTALAYGAILGGALGNILDRVMHGGVFDFLLFHWGTLAFPAFNIADSGIFCGVVALLWDAWRHPSDLEKTDT